jgi:hypothetical protein
MKMKLKTLCVLPMSVIAVFLCMLVLTGCSGATDINDYLSNGGSAPYDPSKAVTVSDFVPKSGGVGQQLVIKGSNFGNDSSIVKVMIGGKQAPLVNVKSNNLYCFVPAGAYSGEIEVIVGESGKEQTATASEKFVYERKMVVGTLCGYKNSQDNQGWQPGPFETCAGFRNDGVMQFSPYNKDQLFIVYDKEPNWEAQHAIQLLDLKERTVQDVLPTSLFTGIISSNNLRLRTIDFAKDPFYYEEDGTRVGRLADQDENTQKAFKDNILQNRWSEHLIVSVDYHNDQYTAPMVYIVDRDLEGEFSANSSSKLLCAYNQCNGASIHPVNGELYFSSYTQGQMLRCDMEAYWESIEAEVAWDPYVNTSDFINVIFPIQDVGFECQIDIHPSGNYAYIVVINKSYMLKTDYNWETKTFSAPYQIAGQLNQRGTDDGVGKSAKLTRPYQGAFAVNPEYEKAGKDDIYDFYFCDSESDRIRFLSPEGIVYTYAGGGSSTHADGNSFGNENGELRDVARFHRPTGFVTKLTYDVLDSNGMPTRIFYILDTKNCQIRTIGYENESSDTAENAGTEDEGPEKEEGNE